MTAAKNSRGPRTPLTRQRVLLTATELADESGIDPLTIRKLATRLGVKPMSIYHHVANKDEILDGMVDAVFGEIDLPPEHANWRFAMRVSALSARSVLARHPWAAAMMESRTSPGPNTLEHHDAVLGCFRRGGFSLPLTAHAAALVDSYIYGFALQEANLPFRTPDELADIVEAIVESIPADEYPNLIEFTTEHALQPGYNFADEFEFGLDLILDGLETAVRTQT